MAPKKLDAQNLLNKATTDLICELDDLRRAHHRLTDAELRAAFDYVDRSLVEIKRAIQRYRQPKETQNANLH